MTPDVEAYKLDPDYHRVASFMGLDRNDRHDFETAKKLAFLTDYVEKDSIAESMKALDDMRKKSGLQVRGKTLIDQLYQRARIKSSRRKPRKT